MPSVVGANLLEWCRWLENTEWARALSESGYAYPLVEGSHVMALAISVGAVVWFDLRLLGWTMRDDRVSHTPAAVRLFGANRRQLSGGAEGALGP